MLNGAGAAVSSPQAPPSLGPDGTWCSPWEKRSFMVVAVGKEPKSVPPAVAGSLRHVQGGGVESPRLECKPLGG